VSNCLRHQPHANFLGFSFISGRYVTHGPPTGYEEFKSTLTGLPAKPYTIHNNVMDRDIITEWNVKGKFMYILLDGSLNDQNCVDDHLRSIWITLGLTGRFLSQNYYNELMENQNDKSTQGNTIRWKMDLCAVDRTTSIVCENRTQIYYQDARNFGTLRFSLSREELQCKLESLGPDLLVNLTQEEFVKILKNQRPSTNICKFLMDQKVC